MRDLMSKLLTGSMVAGAALLVSACGSTEPANNTTANTMEMNAEDSMMMNGTTNDMMTNTDGAMMDGNNMADDNAMMANGSMNAMERNDMMSNDADTNLANGM